MKEFTDWLYQQSNILDGEAFPSLKNLSIPSITTRPTIARYKNNPATVNISINIIQTIFLIKRTI